MQKANIAGLTVAASSVIFIGSSLSNPGFRASKSNNNAMSDPTIETQEKEYCLNSVNQMVKLTNVCLPPSPPQPANGTFISPWNTLSAGAPQWQSALLLCTLENNQKRGREKKRQTRTPKTQTFTQTIPTHHKSHIVLLNLYLYAFV